MRAVLGTIVVAAAMLAGPALAQSHVEPATGDRTLKVGHDDTPDSNPPGDPSTTGQSRHGDTTNSTPAQRSGTPPASASSALQDRCGAANGDPGVDNDGAIAACTEILNGTPDAVNTINAYTRRGLAHIGKEQYDDAESDFTHAIEYASSHSYPDSFSAIVGVSYLGRCNARFSKIWDSEAQRAQVKAGKPLYDSAIEDCSHAITLLPAAMGEGTYLSHAYGTRGICRYEEGQFDLALADGKESVRLTPNDPISILLVGRSEKRLGEENDSKEMSEAGDRDIARAQAIDPKMQP